MQKYRGGARMDLKGKVFFRLTFVLAIMCAFVLPFTVKGSAEFVILVVTLALNLLCTVAGIVLTVKTGVKEKK